MGKSQNTEPFPEIGHSMSAGGLLPVAPHATRAVSKMLIEYFGDREEPLFDFEAKGLADRIVRLVLSAARQ